MDRLAPSIENLFFDVLTSEGSNVDCKREFKFSLLSSTSPF